MFEIVGWAHGLPSPEPLRALGLRAAVWVVRRAAVWVADWVVHWPAPGAALPAIGYGTARKVNRVSGMVNDHLDHVGVGDLARVFDALLERAHDDSAVVGHGQDG